MDTQAPISYSTAINDQKGAFIAWSLEEIHNWTYFEASVRVFRNFKTRILKMSLSQNNELAIILRNYHDLNDYAWYTLVQDFQWCLQERKI
jgi:hypothetical protein